MATPTIDVDTAPDVDALQDADRFLLLRDGEPVPLDVSYARVKQSIALAIASGLTPVSGGFTFVQAMPATTWTITHNLNRFPQVTVVDTTGRQVDADLAYTSLNVVTLSGAIAFAGTAYLA